MKAQRQTMRRLAACSKMAAFFTLFGIASCAKRSEQPASSSSAQSASSAQPAEATLLAAGSPAPEIQAVAHTGENVKLSSFRGRPVVVYFYPKDDTPGCTIEAQEMRDEWKELGKLNAIVLGVSTDNNDSHKAFADKYSLPFLLLPDTDHKIANAFGVPINEGYVKRVTFLIDAKGQIAKVYPAVNPRGHASELVAALSSLK